MNKAKRPRSRQLARERFFRDCEAARLLADQRMREFDRYVELQAIAWIRLIDGRPVYDPHRLAQIQKLRLALHCRKPRRGERGYKGRRAPVEYRRLRPIHVDGHVVDSHSRYCGEDVFHRMDRMLAPPELGVALAPAHFAHVRAYPRHPRTICAPKVDPLLRWRRLKGDPAPHTQMQAYALQHRRTGSSLSTHVESASPNSFSRRRIIPANLNNAAEARSASRCGRAGYPDHVSPAGMSPKTPACPATRAPAPIEICPLTPTCPARTAPSPIVAEPAIPTCAMRRQFSPIRTL